MDISIILPVYHEEKTIKKAIARLLSELKKSPVKCEIIISDGDQGCGTLNSLKGEKIIPVRSKKGRGAQMNVGADAAKGKVLLFLHADSILPAGAFEKILKMSARPDIAGGAFSLAVDSGHWFLKLASAMTNIRCRLNRIPYGDQAIFIKREVFNKLGGFAEIPLMEEVELMRRLRNQRLRIVILKDKVKTSARLWEKDGIFFTTFRNRMISLLYSLGISPEKIEEFYRLRTEGMPAGGREKRSTDGIILFIKYPAPGRVKTRISGKLGKAYTAELYKMFVSDILKKLSGINADTLIYFTPAGKRMEIREWLGPGLHLHPQSGGDIGERMKNAFEEQFKAGYRRLILIGSDIPHMRVSTLLRAFKILKKKESLIGPAQDGGYYLIGFNSGHFLPAVFHGISWSGSSVFTETEKIFERKGLKPALLPVMNDIDTVEDLERTLGKSRTDMPVTSVFWNKKEGKAYGS